MRFFLFLHFWETNCGAVTFSLAAIATGMKKMLKQDSINLNKEQVRVKVRVDRLRNIKYLLRLFSAVMYTLPYGE